MDTGVDNFNICWCCQKAQAGDGVWARIATDHPLPICRKCWELIPVTDRAKIAMGFKDRGESGTRIADALEAIVRMLEMRGGSYLMHRQDDQN